MLFIDRYKGGLSSLRQNVANKPKHVAGPTHLKRDNLLATLIKGIYLINKIELVYKLDDVKN